MFDGASAAFYVDWAAQLDGLFSLARAFGGMLANSGLPFDLTALPPSTLFTQHMPPTMHVVRVRGGGVHHRHAAGFAFETWIGGVGLARVVMDAMSGDAEPRASAAPGEPEASSPEADTRARLRDLRTALTVYKIDQGAFPDELQRLVEPTTNYPSGYLDGRATLSTDGWGRPFRYARTADGASYRVWSVGPDGVDQDGAGDDVRDL